jgi:predicted nucleotidyltransferase
MQAESILDRVSSELRSAYGVHTILLHGSRADGSAGPDSDYDIAAFGPVARPIRIARLDTGLYLDIFVYPDELLLTPSEEYLPLRGSSVLLQRHTQGGSFSART